MSQLAWGIMGTGNIARQFAACMAGSRRGRIVAVGSRSGESAERFASSFSIPTAYPSYEQLLRDRQVQAVYISVPNSMHHEWTLRSLDAGKHVLCEKPFALNADQAKEMFDCARKAGLVLVEAFMYRSHPQTHEVLKAVRSGRIGTVKLIKTSFCFRIAKVEHNIRFKPELGGGALMDVGCYCLDFARLIAGQEPAKIFATARMHPSGVDECVAGVLSFPGGIQASFVCGLSLQADNTACICGDEGYIEIPWPWKPQKKASFAIAHSTPPRQDAAPGVTPARPPRQQFDVEAPTELYALEADDFAATVLDGATPAVTPAQTLGNMRVLDEIRRQIGLPF